MQISYNVTMADYNPNYLDFEQPLLDIQKKLIQSKVVQMHHKKTSTKLIRFIKI